MSLICGARARSVVTIGVIRTRHRWSVEVGLAGGFMFVAESSNTSRGDGNLRLRYDNMHL